MLTIVQPNSFQFELDNFFLIDFAHLLSKTILFLFSDTFKLAQMDTEAVKNLVNNELRPMQDTIKQLGGDRDKALERAEKAENMAE